MLLRGDGASYRYQELAAAHVNPLINEVFDQVRGSWRFRWLAVAAATALAFAGWLTVFSFDDRYEAGASVFVDSLTPLKPALPGLTPEQDINTELNFVRHSLLADWSLLRIASAAGVLPATSTDPQRQALVGSMRQRIDISVGSANGHEEDRNTAGSIYHIAYRDNDRARSLRVVEFLLETLVSKTLRAKREGSERALQFLESQVADYAKRLRLADDQLAAFKSKHPGLVAQQDGYLAELHKEVQKEHDAVDTVTARLAAAEERRATLTRQLHGDFVTGGAAAGQGGGTGSKGSVDTLSLIVEAQARLDELLSKFTEKHPDVVTVRQTLEDLKRRRTREVQAELTQVGIDIAQLHSELDQHQSRMTDLRGYLNAAPQVAAEYARLNRDREAINAQYTALRESLEKARVAERAVSVEPVRFEIVQPATAPYGPVWPRRKLYLAAVLAVAVAAGAALAYGMNCLFPVVNSGGSLARVIGVPVLAEVTSAFPERDRRAFR
ncbi:MAG TPA: hypothetical protein VMG82_20970, partial [Candidatus Sulfotelmatobacter sp.]|nr:hypothetical protein [Candidatus Sulfotelmatobacter sp.]